MFQNTQFINEGRLNEGRRHSKKYVHTYGSPKRRICTCTYNTFFPLLSTFLTLLIFFTINSESLLIMQKRYSKRMKAICWSVKKKTHHQHSKLWSENIYNIVLKSASILLLWSCLWDNYVFFQLIGTVIWLSLLPVIAILFVHLHQLINIVLKLIMLIGSTKS